MNSSIIYTCFLDFTQLSLRRGKALPPLFLSSLIPHKIVSRSENTETILTRLKSHSMSPMSATAMPTATVTGLVPFPSGAGEHQRMYSPPSVSSDAAARRRADANHLDSEPKVAKPVDHSSSGVSMRLRHPSPSCSTRSSKKARRVPTSVLKRGGPAQSSRSVNWKDEPNFQNGPHYRSWRRPNGSIALHPCVWESSHRLKKDWAKHAPKMHLVHLQLSGVICSSELHWNKRDPEAKHGYVLTSEERRSRQLAKEEAMLIVSEAQSLRWVMWYLPHNLRCRLEVQPNESDDWKYCAEFLTVEDIQQFRSECEEVYDRTSKTVTPLFRRESKAEARRHSFKKPRGRSRSLRREAMLQTSKAKRAAQVQKRRVQPPSQEDDVHFDLAVDPVVASTTTTPRWEKELESNLGKYWELPEERPRRARKPTSFFTPC